jgi:hypothetical protein
MQVTKAASIWLEYHRSNSRENTYKAYEAVINRLTAEFGGRDMRELTSEEVLSFLTRMTAGSKQQTKWTRFSHLSAFFSFSGNT